MREPMERLCDLTGGRLIITCGPCGREGSYAIDRLRRRFGEQVSIFTVYLTLTQTCRHQITPGRRIPNVYGITCRAKFDVLGAPKRPPSRS